MLADALARAGRLRRRGGHEHGGRRGEQRERGQDEPLGQRPQSWH